jgi:hypothetical protein
MNQESIARQKERSMTPQFPFRLLFVGLVFLTSPFGIAKGQDANSSKTNPAVGQCPPDPPGTCPPGRSSLVHRLSPRRHEWNSRYVRRDLAPPGTSLHAIHFTQVANAAAARMMLYRYDFLPADARLNARGNWQLTKLADRMQYHGFPILIEATTSSELDEARRAHVLTALSDANIPIDPQHVLISRPLTRGIDGLDAMEIHSGMMQMSAGGGLSGGAGGSVGGGTGMTGAQ